MNDTTRRNRPWQTLRMTAVVVAAGLALSPLLAPAMAYARPAPEGFADLVEQVGPAVVQIVTKRTVDVSAQTPGGAPSLPDEFADGPFRDFFDHYFAEQTPRQGDDQGASPHRGAPSAREMGVGSGFVVSADGTIVTNNHVIDGADSITVRLKDGKELPARLVGADSKTDLAVLKVDAGQPLPSLGWGDSEHARVGDWVVAVGNPFGLTGTVTAGIISSRGRDTGASPYVDFIQIDAPLNSGNSGGPLLNDQGQVIGVNTAIVSPNGGSVGIGFAIPSDTVKSVVAQLESKGSVDRGWLGIAIQPVTSDVADSLGLGEARGALVATITPDSPAQKAGLRQGDVVLNFDGHAVTTPRDLSRVVADTTIGSRKSVSVWRDGRTVDLTVAVGETPKQQLASNESRSSRQEDKASVDLASLGLSLSRGDAAHASKESRVVVAAVDPNGEAADKGIRPGDVILRVNDQTVASPSEVIKAVEDAKAEKRKAVLLLVENQDGQHFVPLKLISA